MSKENYKIISEWNKPGSRYVKSEKGYFREKNGKRMAMVFMQVDGKQVTRHIEI